MITVVLSIVLALATGPAAVMGVTVVLFAAVDDTVTLAVSISVAMGVFVAVALFTTVSMGCNSAFAISVIFNVPTDGTIAGISVAGVFNATGLTSQSS